MVSIIASQDFNALTGSTFTTDSLPNGSPLTNTGSFNIGGDGLDFQTFWFDTRDEGSGPVTPTNDSSDFIGVNTFTGSNAPDVAPDGTPVSNSERNFEFNDTDGRTDLVFESVDVSGLSDRALRFNYWINNTGYESGDAFFITLSDGTNSQTFLNFSEPELEANISPDDGNANWKTATINLDDLISNGFGETLTLTISVDTNAGSENIFVDNVEFLSDFVDDGGNGGNGGNGPDLIPIYEIQGAAQVSPLNGQTVVTRGIVTAVDSNGFYLQDATGDGDDATSNGIFAFTGGRPTVSVGDEVQAEGAVSEFIPGGADTGNLSTTQLFRPTFEVLSSGNDLPAAVILGEGGRIPPNQIIDNDPLSDYQPDEDGIDFYESLEGMRVTIQDALAVSGTNRFGEIFTVVDNGASATGLSDRGTINISPDDFNPERVQIQFDSGILPGFEVSVDTGAQLGNVTGVVGYNFGNFEVNVTEEFTPVDPSNLQPDVSSIQRADDRLTVASYNVLNLDPNDGDGDTDIANGRFETIAQQIVNNLNTPDIIGLQEVQDNNGSDITDIIAADETLQLLIDEIEAISGIRYEFIDNPFIGNETSGGQPGGNIRAAFLYNPERVEFVEGSLQTVVDPADQQTNPDNPFFDTRLPLAGNFLFNGEEVTVVTNHFSSKGGSSPLFGQNQPSVSDQPGAGQEDPDINGSLDERQAQANALNDFVAGILSNDPNANVIAVGDFNEFEFISPLEILEQNLINLTNTLPENERYTFNFQGNSQSLDHILFSDNLDGSALFDIVHVNTEFAETNQLASDHDPLVASFEVLPSDATLGTGGNNALNGTNGDDVILGLGGNDALNSNGGNDVLKGGDGNDTINGSSGSDRIEGGTGNDTINGNGGLDILVGNAGNDRITGGSQADIIVGGDGNDTINGNGGDDLINAGRGNDTVNVGPGNAIVVLTPGEGFDTIRNAQLGSTTFAAGEFDTLTFQADGNGVNILRNGDRLAFVENVQLNALNDASNFV
ncbi:MAG: endonuclease/exonuclease/phosphatase family protein [Elainellaceae cyanobacterium]